MKSRTSSFNPTIFKKDLTRFAPAWAIYLIVLLLVLVAARSDSETYYRVNNMEAFVVVMAWINLGYGAVVAQLLFGDLYNSRLCNALHAMPVTRDGWFVTHVISGLSFSLVPNALMAILALPVMNLGAGWTAVPLWLLAAQLQYLFFFGMAVLCVMLSGNRLGQLALYALVQFGGLLVYWLVSRVYEPMLHGIQINGERFYPLCPAAEISQFGEIFLIDYERITDYMNVFSHYEVYGVAAGEGWGYMAICAVVGMVALIGALALYRRRKLECAGDFVAFSATEPVVLVLVTVFAGIFFHLFGDVFGLSIQYVLLGAGVTVGYFGGLMLLERTTRVFRKKTVLGFVAVVVSFVLSLGITYLDPLGLTRYQPKAEKVESTTVSDSYSILRHSDSCFTVTDPADIDALLGVHAACIDRSATDNVERHPDAYRISIHLEYTLKNGKSVHRIYHIIPESDAGQVLKTYFTTPECVLGFGREQVPEMAKYIFSIYTDGKSTNIHDLEGLDLEGLLYAMVADCVAGNMVQHSEFHGPSDPNLYDTEYDPYVTAIEFGWDTEALLETRPEDSNYDVIRYKYIRIFASCTNTLKWLDENDLLIAEERERMIAEFDGPTATYTTE